jgi:ADP-ribose pyrophosphatase
MHWKVLESKKLFNEPWLNIRVEKCELPNGKVMPAYYILEYPSWANAFAITKDNQVLMVKQYRHAIGEESIELAGGVVDQGESPEEAIKRELLEETGYVFESIELIGKLSANPATSNNYTFLYLAKGGEKVAEQNLDDHEDVEVLLYSIDEVKQLVRDNKILQALHTSCIFYALEKIGKLKYV